MTLQEATLVFLVREKPAGEVLLGLKKAGLGAGKYDGFGGKVEAGETVEQAAARELFEESSIRVALADLQRVAELTFVFPFKPEWSQIVHAFVATQWQGEPAESDEMKPAWFRIDALPYTSMWDDSHYWLPLVLDGRRIRATFTFREDNETVETVDLVNEADVPTRAPAPVAAAVGVRFTDLMVYILLNDGREVGIPLSRLPWLAKATPEQRAKWSLEPQGYAVWWDDLDDGIEVAHVLDERFFA